MQGEEFRRKARPYAPEPVKDEARLSAYIETISRLKYNEVFYGDTSAKRTSKCM